MRSLAVVPARKGSKGIPGKNIRPFCGKPLVSWAIEVGKRTCDHVIVTSDDPDVLAIGQEYGVETLERPEELAADETPMIDVLKHVQACETDQADCLVLLQPTQPLRNEKHVFQALARFGDDCDSVVSVVRMPAHYSPEWALRIIRTGYLGRFTLGPQPTRRQDCEPAYHRDGTVYLIGAALLRRGEMYGRSVPLVVPPEESCTIDDEGDWKRAEEMWERQHARV